MMKIFLAGQLPKITEPGLKKMAILIRLLAGGQVDMAPGQPELASSSLSDLVTRRSSSKSLSCKGQALFLLLLN